MSERTISVTDREADILMMVLSETPTIIERMQKIQWPVTEQELLGIVSKARALVWESIYRNRADK